MQNTSVYAMYIYRCANERCAGWYSKKTEIFHLMPQSNCVTWVSPSSEDLCICLRQDNTASRQFAQLRNNNVSIVSVSPVCRSISRTSNLPHASSLPGMAARTVVLPPAPFVVCYLSWKNSLSAELKAESVWHRGCVGPSYHCGTMWEECFWSTWPFALWWLISPLTSFSPSCNKHTSTHSRHTVNGFSPRTSGKGAVCLFSECLYVFVHSQVAIRNDSRLLE